MSQVFEHIKQYTEGLGPVEALAKLAALFSGEIIFSTSFGWEDQAITHMILKNNLPVKVFTLETGRLFPETYYVWNRTLEMYGKPIHAYYPQHEALQRMVDAKGPNSFYESVENRKECCNIRKIEPLKRALAGNKLWITGIRAEQSANRQFMEPIEWDESNQIVKFHPIYNWTLDEVKQYISINNIPTMYCTTVGSPALGAHPVRELYNLAKISAPGAGGGKINRKKNAAYT